MELELFGGGVEIDRTFLEASADAVEQQVREYERGERETFDLETAFPDTFLGDVMAVMAAIPYGETRTYGDIAADLDTAPIAVGQACGRNPVPLVVPCHRVVGSDGGLHGYSAPGGVALKRRLLEHEGVAIEATAPR
jgi:methylated-DNA-[protein]-cysteine S-methyltransferase